MFGISSCISSAILEEGGEGLNTVKHRSVCSGERNIIVHGGIAKRGAPPTVDGGSAVKVHTSHCHQHSVFAYHAAISTAATNDPTALCAQDSVF